MRHPIVKKCAIATLHDLIASRQFLRYPARNIANTFGGHPSRFSKAPVDWHGVTKVFDNHVEHQHISTTEALE